MGEPALRDQTVVVRSAIDVALQQFTTLTFLSPVNDTRLGEDGSSFSRTATEAPNKKFRAALEDVEDKIAKTNAARAFDYPCLLPSRIPASTNI